METFKACFVAVATRTVSEQACVAMHFRLARRYNRSFLDILPALENEAWATKTGEERLSTRMCSHSGSRGATAVMA